MSWLIDQITTDNQKGQGNVTDTADTVTTTKTPTTVTRNLPQRSTTRNLPGKSTTRNLPARTTTRTVPDKTTTQTRDGSTVVASKEDAQTTVATVLEDASFHVRFKFKIRGGLGSGATTPLCP